MAKRSQRRPSRHERNNAGCIWGLISIFDFRQGRSSRRLLADRGRVNKQAAGGKHLSNQTNLLGPTENCGNVVDDDDDEESKMHMADGGKTSVKELMEEEMFNEQGSTDQPDDYKKGLEEINSKYGNLTKTDQKRKNRKPSNIDVSRPDAVECLMPENYKELREKKTSDNLDLETIMEELAQINQKKVNCTKNDFHSDIPSGQALTDVEEKLVEAVKLFIERKLSNSKRFGEDGDNLCSKDFMQTLSSNKGLFLKLLHDQDSDLVRHIQNIVDARIGKDQTPSSSPANLSEEIKSDEVSSRKHRNFFRRRTKSLDSYPLGEDTSNKIVILKPGTGGAHTPEIFSNLSLRSHHERNTSQFSFTEIKRKLKHAMGKERHGISPDRLVLKVPPKAHNGNNGGDKGALGEGFGWSSPNRNHFYTERFTGSSPSFKKGEPVDILKENGSLMVNETCQYPKHGGSNIYIEAKKHLLEMLKSGDKNPESFTGQLPKSLGRILSLPEYNGSPCCSPRKHGDDIFITAQMRLSPRGMGKNASRLLQENHDDHLSPRMENSESRPFISGSSGPEEKVQSLDMSANIPLGDDREYSSETRSFVEDTIVHEVQSSSSVVVEVEEMSVLPQEEEKMIRISIESSSNSINGDIQEGDNEESSSRLLKPEGSIHLFGEDQIFSSPTVSPSHCQANNDLEDPDCAIDKMERPSPISVLEPLFTDDDISPASIICQPVEKEIQPRHIHFEEQSSASDQGICMRISPEDVESAYEYVEAVLLGSGLNWDEFLLRWLSLYEILDSSLFDEVELFSSRPRHDQKLLFDSANEALKEVCESYFGCFTGVSHVQPNIRPVPKAMDLIQEIWKRVEWHLFQHPQPHSLEQLVQRDLARSRKWMNLLSDIDLIVFEMGETIFEEMVEDTVLSFIDDTSSACEFSVLQDEYEAIEDINFRV